MKISEQIAIVTGGASGLGEATVKQLVSDGAKVAIFDYDEKRGQLIADELASSVIFCKTDVTNSSSVVTAIEKTMEKFGAIHVAINCAGVGTPMKVLGKQGPVAIEDFNRVVQINLIGTMNVVRLSAEKMVLNTPNEDGEKGVIINTASVAAFEGQIGQVAYSASKAGVIGMTLPIAREFANFGIRIMSISPGFFMTPLMATLPDKIQAQLVSTVPFPKRFGKPAEFAMLVKHIIENPVLNGENIRLDSAIRM